MSEELTVKEDICKTMAALYGRGLIAATGGNVSARISGMKEFWITPSRIFKGELDTPSLVKINLEGNVIEGYEKPSAEIPMHRAIYKNRQDVNAVIHAHNPVATGLALAGIEIEPVTIEAVLTLGKVPIVPFTYPGTESLARAVVKYLPGVRALILQNHGVVGLGFDLVEAKTIVETLEEVAQTQWVAYHFGKPKLISKKDLAKNQ